MCLNPISVINPSKYISLKYRDPYLLQVPCGKCAECQSSKSLEWQYRTYIEFCDCIVAGGFSYFDTLTYCNKYLPKISDFVKTDYDFPCFNHRHITNFFKLLRIRLKRAGYDYVNFKYFLASEYGTNPSDGFTYRPHYHVVFFVYGDIKPLIFSSFVSDCWKYGLTDGFPYKSKYYVETHNTIMENNNGNILKTTSYITKYVQKSSLLQNELDKRVSLLMKRINEDFCEFEDFEDSHLFVYQDSPDGRKFRLSLNRNIQQFHRQSLHFGESGLSNIDIKDLFNTGVLIMPHHKALKLPVVLPTYYKRKLFYRLVDIDGGKSWQLTDFGREYKQARSAALLRDLENRFKCVCFQYHLSYDHKELADYVYNKRGKIKGQFDSVDILKRLESVDLFNYVSLTDKQHLKYTGLVPNYIGNCHVGYNVNVLPAHIKISDFISKYVFLDAEKERQLTHIYSLLYKVNTGKQSAFELKQRLSNIYKCFL